MWRDVSEPRYNGNIQIAVDAAGQSGDTVYIPAGTYRIDKAIRLPNRVSLVGDGYCSVIQLNDNPGDNVIVADGYPSASDTWASGIFRGETRNLRIANLRIRGNGAATDLTSTGPRWEYIGSGNGIMLLAVTDSLIENCWVENCYRGGILLGTGAGIDNPNHVGGSRNVIRNCRVVDCGANGINLHGGERNEARGGDFALIEGCFFERVASHGIRVVNSRFVRVLNNTVVGCKEDGIRIDQCLHVLVIGNAVLDGTRDSNGIKFSSSVDCIAIGNACHHNNQPNLELLNSQWCTLAYNVTTASDEWGIISRTGVPSSGPVAVDICPPKYQDESNQQYQKQAWINTGHIIQGNLAVNNGSGGIALYGTHNSIVAGNVAALNNLSRSTTWEVPGIRLGFGDGSIDPAVWNVVSVGNVVADNRCYDDQGNQTQDYGLTFETGPNHVVGNNTVGNRVAGSRDGSNNNAIRGRRNNR